MNPFEILRLTLLVIHFIGLAAIIGSFIFQLPKRTGIDFRAMLTGTIVQLVTGAGLIAARRAESLAVIDAKMAVKLGIALLVLIAVIVGMRRSKRADASVRPWFLAAGVLAIADVVVATVWS
jgi:hypothetical protein